MIWDGWGQRCARTSSEGGRVEPGRITQINYPDDALSKRLERIETHLSRIVALLMILLGLAIGNTLWG
jgi:hypothetical protein